MNVGRAMAHMESNLDKRGLSLIINKGVDNEK